MNTRLCVFCLRVEGDPTPWVPDNPGKGCQYGYDHEFPAIEVPKPPPIKKVDSKLCQKCGLHPKNPASQTNGCAHEYVT